MRNNSNPSSLHPLLIDFFLIMMLFLLPDPVQAQGQNDCPINPFYGARQLHREGEQGDMVYIVCVNLGSQYLRFETVMANGIEDVNPSRDQRETITSMTKREKHAVHDPIVAFNADYFGVGHGAEGLTVINGIRIDGPQNKDCDNPKFADCRDNAIYRASLSVSRLNAVEISHKGAPEVTNEIIQLSRFYTSVGGGPLLVKKNKVIPNPCTVPGENVKLSDCRDTRQTAVGISKDGKTLIIVVAESRTGQQMGDILKRYGAYTALKLDGGGSSQLWVNGDLIYHDPEEGEEGRRVVNGILIFSEKVPRHDSILISQSEFPVVAPGERVNISFELQNTGFLTWKHKLPYNIRFMSGSDLGLSQFYPLSADVAPGARVQWSQSISAPQEPGTYQTSWQMTFEDGAGNIEKIGPEIGYIVTVVPEGGSLDLGSVVRQFAEELLSRIVNEITRRIEEELRNITVCGQPVFGILILTLVLSKRKRKDK